jgi:hypothetical protein
MREADMGRVGDDFGGRAKRRSGWLIPLVVFFVTACLSALMLAYYFAPAPRALSQEQPAPTDATRAIELMLGDTPLRIPANYIPMASARSGGAVPELALIAFLPDLQGYTLGAAQALAGNAPDSPVVSMMLKSGQTLLPEQERLERIYSKQVEDAAGKAGPYGLRQYTFRMDSGYHDQDMFVGMTDGGTIVLLCTKLAPGVTAPNCMRDMPLGDGVSLSYRFRRAYLADWRKIDTGVRARIASFMEKA